MFNNQFTANKTVNHSKQDTETKIGPGDQAKKGSGSELSSQTCV